jgi:hypothetical protein
MEETISLLNFTNKLTTAGAKWLRLFRSLKLENIIYDNDFTHKKIPDKN